MNCLNAQSQSQNLRDRAYSSGRGTARCCRTRKMCTQVQSSRAPVLQDREALCGLVTSVSKSSALTCLNQQSHRPHLHQILFKEVRGVTVSIDSPIAGPRDSLFRKGVAWKQALAAAAGVRMCSQSCGAPVTAPRRISVVTRPVAFVLARFRSEAKLPLAV